MGGVQRGGLRQPDHDAGGDAGRLLHGHHLPRHVRRRQVRGGRRKCGNIFPLHLNIFLSLVPLGRRQHGEDPYQVLRAALHRLPDDLDPGPGGGRATYLHMSQMLYAGQSAREIVTFLSDF